MIQIKKFVWDQSVLENLVPKASMQNIEYKPIKPCGKRIVLIDCGVKHGILRVLLDCGYEIIRIPWNTDPLSYRTLMAWYVRWSWNQRLVEPR